MVLLQVREAVTQLNDGPVVSIVNWVLLVAVILAVSVKIVLARMSFGLRPDDWFILASATVCIVQSSIVFGQISRGAGQHVDNLSSNQLLAFQKLGYTASLLFILTMALSKISVMVFFKQLSPRPSRARAATTLSIFIAIWSTASFLVVAFQCHVPSTWSTFALGTKNEESSCIDIVAFSTSYGVINMATELLLVLLPSETIYGIKADWHRRTVIIFCFCTRLTIIPSTILQLVTIYRAGRQQTHHDNDPTFESWPIILTQQITQALSVITVCIPYIKGLLVGLESGMFQTGHLNAKRLKQMSFSKRFTTDKNASSTALTMAVSGHERDASSIGQSSQPPGKILRVVDFGITVTNDSTNNIPSVCK